MINQSILDSMTLARCSHSAVLLFILLWEIADDDGILPLDPSMIRRKVACMGDELTDEDVCRLIDELRAVDCLRVWMDDQDGRAYIAVTNFFFYQTINKPTPSRWPRPPWVHKPDNGLEGRARVKRRCSDHCDAIRKEPAVALYYGSPTVAVREPTTVALPSKERKEGRKEEGCLKEHPSSSGLPTRAREGDDEPVESIIGRIVGRMKGERQ